MNGLNFQYKLSLCRLHRFCITQKLSGSSLILLGLLFWSTSVWAEEQSYVLSHQPKCHEPVIVWHHAQIPDQLILSPIQKEYPDVSERWGLKPCHQKPIYVTIKTGQKVRLPQNDGHWEVSEGQIQDGIWTPEIQSQPRMAWVRHSQPGLEPQYTLYGISAPAELPVQTTPQTSVTVFIEEKAFGPVMADEQGLAQLRVEIPPSAVRADILLENGIGQQSESTLTFNPKPLIVPTWRRGPNGLYLHVLTFSPKQKKAVSLQCEGGLTLKDGFSTIVIPNPDQILSCSYRGKAIAISEPPIDAEPALLKLNTFPRIMSVDRPSAKIQLEAFDKKLSPLDPKGLMLQADIGELRMAIVDDKLLADYDGSAAQLLGGDTLTATWNPPGIDADPFFFRCQTYRSLSERYIRCQICAKDGQPVRHQTAHFRVEQNILSSLKSDSNGWLEALKIPQDTPFVSISTADILQYFYIEPTLTDKVPSQSAISQRQHLIITSGAVREIRIETSQPVHELNSNKSTDVQVELYDISGQIVKDESIFLTVSDGEISEPEQGPNGEFTARYKPSGNIQYGTVKIMASALNGAYTASTSLQITPNQLIRGIGLSGGVIAINDMPLSRNMRAYAIRRSPLGEKIFGVLGFERIPLQSYDSSYRINQNLIPITMGISYRSIGGRLGSYLDGMMAVSPYRIQVLYAENSILNQWGMTYPGFEVGAGVRYRQGSGELISGGRFLSIPFSPDSIGWNQQFTAILFELGYFWSY